MLYAFDEYKHLKEFAGITACYNFQGQITLSQGNSYTFNIPGVHTRNNLMITTSAYSIRSSEPYYLALPTYFEVSPGADGISTDIKVYIDWMGSSGTLSAVIYSNIYVLENL